MSKHIAIAASLVAALAIGGAVAWTHSNPLREELSLPASVAPRLHPPGVEYRGDKLEVLEHSRVAPFLSGSGRVALLILGNAEVFASSRVYVNGMLSPHAVAFRKLLREPAAQAAFRELAQSANPPAALYGLSGLYLVDRVAYAGEAQRLKVSGMHLEILIGCTLMTATITELLDNSEIGLNIASGSWPRELAGS